jgi:uncharacterized 2Fe-2S/4Fe-4S cluster protein (DUF4445 family)
VTGQLGQSKSMSLGSWSGQRALSDWTVEEVKQGVEDWTVEEVKQHVKDWTVGAVIHCVTGHLERSNSVWWTGLLERSKRVKDWTVGRSNSL